MLSPDLNAGNFALPQTLLQPMPVTIASAAAIAPTTLLSVISGAVAIVNITPPQEGAHMLIFVSSGTWAMTAAGNIATAIAATTAGQVVLMFYNPATKKYSGGKLAVA
jgi:hypothetical protein